MIQVPDGMWLYCLLLIGDGYYFYLQNALNEVLQSLQSSLQSATSIDTRTLTGEFCSYVNRTLRSLADDGKIRVTMNAGIENLGIAYSKC